MSEQDRKGPAGKPGTDTSGPPKSPDKPAWKQDPAKMRKEVGGREGPEPTRYGD
ncbi:MAG TPA: DUF1674 domain-containing protein, partial [Alphaproteobacteria bacterium]|nr:DUF1674 domain-containing protein [Alphaproteobacteria bacterium]